jgi:peptide/nickel transport system substrate-binding protein
VTADDFLFTLEAVVDPLNGAAETPGYDLITWEEVIDTKTVLFAFSEVYGPWQSLFEFVLPSHVLIGADSEDAPGFALTTTSGPFIVDEWIEGERITLRRNDRYWSANDPLSGLPLGSVDLVHFVYPESTRDMMSDLEDGVIDVVNPRPLEWIVAEAQDVDGLSHQLAPGPFWDHVDFNHDDPLLSQKWVREVITLAIDRETILDETVRTVDSAAVVLDSTVSMTNSSVYEPHLSHRYDPEAAEQILVDRFCVKDDDDIYSCQGRRMSFVWATTLGDEFRETQFELIQDALEAIGVELIGDFMTPSRLFSSEVFFGGPEMWQIINFSWKAAADPYLGNSTYFCEGSAPNGFGALNVNRFCNLDVDALIRSTASQADGSERSRIYNEADARYLGDLAMIPLYQKPAFIAWNTEISGPELNISRSTDLWNIAAWTGKEVVVIALESEPQVLNPVVPRDTSEAMVLAALFSGAFGITPTMEFRPVLIESAETIVSER